MEARYLILARFAEFGSDGTLNIIGGDVDKVLAQNFPLALLSMTAAAKILLDADDLKIDHRFKTFVKMEEGEVIAEGPSGILPKAELPAGLRYIGAQMILTFGGLVFPSAGWHKITLEIDDREVLNAKFRVMGVSEVAEFESIIKSFGRVPKDDPKDDLDDRNQ